MRNNINDKIIILGDVRLRAKSVKNYGLATKKRYYEKVYKKTWHVEKFLWMHYTVDDLEWAGDSVLLDERRHEDLLKKHEPERKDGQITIGDMMGIEYKTTYRRYRDDDGELVDSNELTTEDDIIEKKEEYLYITTYQKDNFIFYQNDVHFNIRDKCAEMDMIFG